MIEISKYTLQSNATIRQGLQRINEVNGDAIFLLDSDSKMVGTLTDGDIRRALLENYTLESSVDEIMFRSFRYLNQHEYSLEKIDEFKAKMIDLLPVLDEEKRIVKILSLNELRSVLPFEVLLMAGGRGERLRPLTDEVPKPMLKVGDKPIIEHNIDRLALYGIEKMSISVKYKAEQIENYFGTGEKKGITIEYIHEDEPLGTLGAIKLIETISTPSILVMNSDLLTNIDFEDFFRFFEKNQADMAVASTSYRVKVPYGVLETTGNTITALQEKPTYTYFSNAGIYLIKTELLDRIPKHTHYNATDLMDQLIKENKKIVNYPIVHYWLDIGNPTDFERAQEDVKHIKF